MKAKNVLQSNVQASTHRWVYNLNEFERVNSKALKEGTTTAAILGGKGSCLAEMTSLNLPIPVGLIVTTEACNRYLQADQSLDNEVWNQILAGLADLEKETGKKLGDPTKPLLVSCRSGAKLSMPGMMDTVLNLGMNSQVVKALSNSGENSSFAHDLYRRLIQMFSSVVMGIDDDAFEEVLAEKRAQAGVSFDFDLTSEQWVEICETFEGLYLKETGSTFPQDPKEQIRLATEAVFKSWNGKRAIDYRNASGIPHDWGTAVNIMTMVFGNRDSQSATGVCFTRNPDTGENELYGDFLVNAQGEDVVSGTRNTLPIKQLEAFFPEVYQQFYDICHQLEDHFQDMQDIEFTIEQGKLWILQTRNGKRTARAAIKIAVDQVEEKLISKKDALLRVSPNQVDTILHPNFDVAAKQEAVDSGRAFTKGVNASPGAAVGAAVFDADKAEEWGKAGKAVIMVRPFTKPDDIHGMLACKGILTAEGGATSHAAVVARQFGVPCVVGASSLEIDLEKKQMRSNDLLIKEGETISIDGSTGECFLGDIPSIEESIENQVDLKKLLHWADAEKKLRVWANADNPKDAKRAIDLGAEGIGLCRTEHMFFHEDRLPIFQKMILSKDEAEKDECLARLLEFQRSDFIGLFKVMEGRPIIIRLIDPPLHEFIPEKDDLLIEVHDLKHSKDQPRLAEKEALLKTIEAMHESNPMMGLRGVRLSIILEKIVTMQVRAIFEAACEVASLNIPVNPEIMIPLVSHPNELKTVQPQLERVADEVMQKMGVQIKYQFGSMIELPRACVVADEIAQIAQFFSFGTNDLTQMTFGLSRDDAESSFLLKYLERGILSRNPFKTLDINGVGKLIIEAVKLGRKINPEIQIGVCGEHGGDPESIKFFDKVGLNYVSCSPLRIPVARLAAAQAALSHA